MGFVEIAVWFMVYAFCGFVDGRDCRSDIYEPSR